MRIEIILGASFLIFLLLHFAVLPRLAGRLRRGGSWNIVGLHGVYSLLATTRSVSAVAFGVSLSVLACLWILEFAGGASFLEIENCLLLFKSCRDALLPFTVSWVLISGGLLFSGLLLHAYWRGRRQMLAALSRAVNMQVNSIVADMRQGTLTELPPSDEMQKVATLIHEYSAGRASAEANATLDETQRKSLLDQYDNEISKLEGVYIHLDLDRRVDLKPAEDDVDLPRPRNRFERVQMLLMSRGLLRARSAVSGVVYLVSLTVLIPSMLGICGAPGVASLEQRISALHVLRLQTQSDVASTAIASVSAKAEEGNELAPEDEQVLRQVADRIDLSAMSSQYSPVSRVPSTVQYSLRSASTRQSILSAAAAKSKGTFDATPWIANEAGISPHERNIAEALESSWGKKAPRRPLSQEICTRLRGAALRKPELISQWRSQLAAFQNPANVDEIIFGSVHTLAVEPGKFAADSATSRILQQESRACAMNAVAELVSGKSDLRNAISVASTPDSMLARVTTGDLIEMRGRLRDMHNQAIGESRHLQTRLQLEEPPSIVQIQKQTLKESRVIPALERMRNRLGGPSGRLVSQADKVCDVMSGYRDYFPEHVGADLKTMRGRLLSRWNAAGIDTATSKTSFLRSRSFSGLRGFSRVGGVLLGRDPREVELHGSSTPDDIGSVLICQDIQWDWRESELQLILVDTEGQSHRSAWFRPRFVEHALTYAADGRPTTVTIVNTDPLPFRQILLHPALVDTPLGLRMIDLDQWVYRYLKNQPEFQARHDIEGHFLLYSFAQASRILEIKDTSLFSDEAAILIKDMQKRATVFFDVAKDFSQNDEAARVVTQALNDPSCLRDPDRSPLPKMTDYFDAKLVRWIQEAADETDELSEFISQIQDESRREWLSYENGMNDFNGEIQAITLRGGAPESEISRLRDRESELRKMATGIFQWVFPAPEHQEASGVREAPFSLSYSDLLSAEIDSAPSALEFTVQLAFTSPPYFKAQEDDSLPAPWEYGALKPVVEREVSREIAKRPSDQEILRDVAQFTLLQRLFRTAFSGRLGPDFPIEKLNRLAEEISDRLGPSTCVTPKWDFGETKGPGDAGVEIRLAVALLSKYDSLPNELSAEMSDSMSKILANALQALVGRETASPGQTTSGSADLIRGQAGLGASAELKGAVVAHIRLLAERLRDVAELEEFASQVPGSDYALARSDVETAWARYETTTASWTEQWGALNESLQDDTDQPQSVATGDSKEQKSEPNTLLGSTRMSEIVTLLSAAHDQLIIQHELGISEDAKLAFFHAVLTPNAFPSLD